MGLCTSYYENGNMKAKTRYDKKIQKKGGTEKDSIDFSILEFDDSLGNQLVREGEGWLHGRLNLNVEQGKVVNAHRDSVWTTFYDNGKVYCFESWNAGRLVDGISFDRQGKEYYYKQDLVLPSPALGMQQFYKEVGNQMSYPREAQKRGVQGKVIVELVIGDDGSITSPRILKGLGFGCDEEALKVLMTSAPWIPCRQKGQFVSYRITIPIIFKIT